MTAAQQRPDEQADETELSGRACTGGKDLACWMDEVGAALAEMTQRFRAFNNRLHHMARDLSGMSMDLSDVTDQVADIRDTTGMVQTSNQRIDIEIYKMRSEIARLTGIVDKHNA